MNNCHMNYFKQQDERLNKNWLHEEYVNRYTTS